jgi:hypothetical protein
MALSALQYSLLKLSLRAFSSANRYTVPNLSEADLNSFWNQLAAEATASGVALSAPVDAAIDRTFRAMVATGNDFLRFPDADWATFFTQLTTDAAGAATLPAAQYAAVKLQLRATLSAYNVSPFTVSDAALLGYLQPRVGSSFAGDFGALFTGYGLTVNGYFRSDLGVSGTAGTGKSTWANQLGSGSNITTGVSATNGIGSVGAGLNSKASIVTDTSTQFGIYTLPTSVTPGTTNRHIVKIKRTLVTPASIGYQDTTSGVTTSIPTGQTTPAAEEQIFNATLGALTSGVVINQWYACRYSWIGGLDQIRIGAHEPAPVSTSNSIIGTAWTFCGVNTASVSQEHLLYMAIDGPLATFLTAYADFCVKARAFWTTAIEV